MKINCIMIKNFLIHGYKKSIFIWDYQIKETEFEKLKYKKSIPLYENLLKTLKNILNIKNLSKFKKKS